MEGVAYHENVYRELAPGHIILAATDALWETRNLDGEEFTMERLQDALRAVADKSATEISAALRNAVKEWCAPRKPDDDMTLVVVKVL